MKIFRMLGRSMRDAFKSVVRNFSLSLASISCITITLIIVAIAIMASFNVQNFTKEIERDLTIVVFMDNDATEDDINQMKTILDSKKNIAKYTFESKNAVRKDMMKENDVFESVMKDWKNEDNPLRDTFKIKVKNVENMGKTADQMKELPKVDTVQYGEGMVERLVNAFSSIEKVAYGVVIALVIVTIFLIINTIKLTIFSRKREIGIMRLVGASNFAIKVPFIIEGMILGFFGAIVPVILITYGYLAFYNHFEGHLFTPLIELIQPEPFIYQASLIIIVIGIIVGMVGSAGAVRKYLKV